MSFEGQYITYEPLRYQLTKTITSSVKSVILKVPELRVRDKIRSFKLLNIIKRRSETLPKMKLWRSVIVASTIAKNHEKSCSGQNCGCNAEEMMRWKNEMKNWESDQASEFLSIIMKKLLG